MAVDKLLKITILAKNKDKVALLDFLHKEGFLHISKPSYLDSQELPTKEVSKLTNVHAKKVFESSPLSCSEDIASGLLTIQWFRRHFNLEGAASFSHRSLTVVLKELKSLQKEIEQKLSVLANEEEQLKKEQERLIEKEKSLKGLLFDIPAVSKEELLATTPLLFSGERLDNVLKSYECVFSKKEDQYFILCLKEDEKKLTQELINIGGDDLSIPSLNKSVIGDIKGIAISLNKVQKRINHVKKEIINLEKVYAKQLLQLEKDLMVYHHRYSIHTSCAQTKHLFLVSGYLIKDEAKKVKKLQKTIPVHIIGEELDAPPSNLSNGSYVGAYEMITKMFGLPSYNHVDPTPFLAFFIPLFFGLMLSDVGYGIGVLLLTLALSRKKESQTLKDAKTILTTCAISTVFFGFAFGSFFGNLVEIPAFLFNPFSEAKLLLVGSLIIGLIHLNLGSLLAWYEKTKHKSLLQGIREVLGFFSLQAAIVFLVLGMKNVGYVLLGVAFFGFIWRNSLQGLMDISGILGAWFSYARILALGLATGGIALGINIMSSELQQLGTLGLVLAIILLIVGHLFNFVINVLGCCIHAVRLHYVEFFSQFYDPKGKPFKPYKIEGEN